MFARAALPLLACLSLAGPVRAQAPVNTPIAAPTVAQARQQAEVVLTDSLRAVNVTLDRLKNALGSVTVRKWKAPGDVRQTADGDVESMQRDLQNTLPQLVSTALASPSKMSPSFAVYRNVDALYDVLLRVSETAQLAGSSDARTLEDQRMSLEQSRTQLGAALLQATQAQDNEVVQLHTAATAPPAAAPKATNTVVDDGPQAKPKTTRRHRSTTTPAQPKVQPQQPQQ